MNEALESILERLKNDPTGTATIDASVVPDGQTIFELSNEIVSSVPIDIAISASTTPQRIFLAWEPRAAEDYPDEPA